LAHRIPLNELYGSGYGYLSGMNNTMKKHLEEIAHEAESLIFNPPLRENDNVLDIGSNDGTLLRGYQTKDIFKVGMDDIHFMQYYTDKGTLFIPEFFSKESFFDYEKFKIITSIAMFYDLENPHQFVSDIKSILLPEGVWILELSYLPTMIAKNAFDTICHEHLEYYRLKQIKWLLDECDLKIFDVRLTNANGGSFMIFVCHSADKRPFNKTVNKMIEGESRHGFDTSEPFVPFVKQIGEIKEKLIKFLLKEKEKGKTIHLYGASTKGNVLLQTFGIDYRLVSFAAEKNSAKYGCWTPGTHIPIMSEEFSRNCKPDYYLVLPWHFRFGFIEREHEYLKSGGKLIFPLPDCDIVSISKGEIVVRQI
jgi:hypothetical protein